MPKLTPAELEKRRKKLQEEALESVASRGQVKLSFDGDDIKSLYKQAGNKRKPVGIMMRDWILERLSAEESER
jgi:hypothetical protein